MAEALQGAAVKYLLNIPELVNTVGKFDLTLKPFIFQDEMLVNLEKDQYSEVSAIVVRDGGPLAVPGLTRFRHRRIAIDIWANGTRDGLGNLVNPKIVNDKIAETFQILDKYMHRTNPSTVIWYTTPTHASERIGDIGEPISIIDGDGIKVATVYYSVII